MFEKHAKYIICEMRMLQNWQNKKH